jgi:hypothetical protein
VKKSIYILFLTLAFHQGTSQDTIFSAFHARQTDDGILITFTIRSGITCSGVRILRGANEFNFEEIHEFIGVCGSVNTEESYAFTDQSPFKNRYNYYKLDLGSLGLSSSTIAIHFIDYGKDDFIVFPNPAVESGTIHFENFNGDIHQFIFYDIKGRAVHSGETSGNRIDISSRTIGRGNFYFRIYRNSEPRMRGKIIFL